MYIKTVTHDWIVLEDSFVIVLENSCSGWSRLVVERIYSIVPSYESTNEQKFSISLTFGSFLSTIVLNSVCPEHRNHYL